MKKNTRAASLHFDYKHELKHIIVVGLGGTGSQLARSIARMMFDMRGRRMSIPHLTFIDPDLVEAKNVGRQMFVPADVGQNKAEILARRFNAALGLEIGWRAETFNVDRHIGSESWSSVQTLMCGAVDNHLARREMARRDNTLWIDCGNHFSAGQVVIGTTGNWNVIRQTLKRRKADGEISELPNAAALFPSLLEPEESSPSQAKPELSCADLVAHGEQHLLVNDWIAGVAASYVYRLLHRQPLTSFVSFVDVDAMNVRSVSINRPALMSYFPAASAAQAPKAQPVERQRAG